ncbi:MAG: FG-GAP-like repeat-containing protein [Bacteroidota bacterium]
MKPILLYCLLLFSATAYSQGNFVLQTDTANPINTFSNAGTYRGCAWADINNDGLIDFHAAPNYLFMNMGGGQFTSVPNPMFPNNPLGTGPASTSWADYDNDGDIDCFIGARKSRLYRNDGTGQFTLDSTMYATSGDYLAWSAAMGDINNDSRMDVCQVYANGFFPGTTPTPCFLQIQDVNGILNNITGYAFTDSLAAYTVPYFSDFDLDGDMDLFVASGPAGTPGFDYCYRNLKMETGVDTLERIFNTLFASQKQDGQCYNFIDYDNDGDMDLCLTNYNGAPTRFYKNDNGTYNSLTLPFTTTTVNLANCWGDYDNDGDLDVIITNDGGLVKYYRNDGNSVFTSVNLNLTTKAGGAGASNCDYDNDGDLDLFIMGTGTAKGLYKNDSLAYGNNWVNIKCTGTTSNKSAIGTIVKIKSVINGQSVWQLREINAMNSFMGHNDLRVHFGLGNATLIDSVIIHYLNGGTEIFTGVSANTFYSNTEGSGILSAITSIKEKENPAFTFTAYPNPAGSYLLIKNKNQENISSDYQLYNTSGIILKSASLENDTTTINTASLPSGIYFICIKAKNYYQNIKFIKE